MNRPHGRRNPERHKAGMRAANRARYRAVRLLISLYQGEYDRIYEQQCLMEDPPVKPKRSRVTGAEQLRAKIAELEGQLADAQAGVVSCCPVLARPEDIPRSD